MFFQSHVLRRCGPSLVVRLSVHLRSLQTSGWRLQYRKTHYETLGLTSNASQSDIKSAYYKLSMKYHPDKTKGAEDKFKNIATAYEVLGNPRMRRLYDRGIISHNDDDETIHQHAGTDESGESIAEQTESQRVSAVNYDLWSKQQASATFNRSQTARRQKEHLDSRKAGRSEDSSAEAIVWVFFVLGLLALSFATFGSNSSNRTPKKEP